MTKTMRRCAQCGRNDVSRTWPSMAAAADEGALQTWACPNCAWPEAELVEVDEAAIGADGGAGAGLLARVEADAASHTGAGSRQGR